MWGRRWVAFGLSALLLGLVAPIVAAAPADAATYTEQQGSHGAKSFLNYHNASGIGTFVAAMSYVQVSCKVYDPTITSVNPDGYWYRLASSPWNDAYYSP